MTGKTRHPARPCAIEEIIAEMRGYSYGMPPSYHVTMSWADFRALLDRIEAAHKREVREAREAVDYLCERMADLDATFDPSEVECLRAALATMRKESTND